MKLSVLPRRGGLQAAEELRSTPSNPRSEWSGDQYPRGSISHTWRSVLQSKHFVKRLSKTASFSFSSPDAFLVFSSFSQRMVACTPGVLSFGEWQVQKATGHFKNGKFCIEVNWEVIFFPSALHCKLMSWKSWCQQNKIVWMLKLIKNQHQI